MRTKPCHICGLRPNVLYRCRYDTAASWCFLCEACLLAVKAKYADSYQYGGTWKADKHAGKTKKRQAKRAAEKRD